MDNFYFRSVVLAVYSLLSFQLWANESDEHTMWYELPQRISGDGPVFPSELKRDGLEGWVQLSLVVSPTGEVIEPLVRSSSGHSKLEESALTAVNTWRFEPATKERIWQRVQVNFRQDADGSDGVFDDDLEQGKVNKRFLSRFNRGMSAISKGDMETAKEKWLQLKSRTNSSWTENSYLWVLDAYFHNALEAWPQVLTATEKVLVNGQEYLPRNLYVEIIKKRFIAAIQSNQLNIAVNVFHQLQDMTDDNAVIESLQPYASQAKGILANEDVLESVGLISTNWHQPLSKKNITVAVLEGELSKANVRCDDFQKGVSGQQEVKITIPDSAKNCHLIVFGKPNSVVLTSEI